MLTERLGVFGGHKSKGRNLVFLTLIQKDSSSDDRAEPGTSEQEELLFSPPPHHGHYQAFDSQIFEERRSFSCESNSYSSVPQQQQQQLPSANIISSSSNIPTYRRVSNGTFCNTSPVQQFYDFYANTSCPDSMYIAEPSSSDKMLRPTTKDDDRARQLMSSSLEERRHSIPQGKNIKKHLPHSGSCVYNLTIIIMVCFRF